MRGALKNWKRFGKQEKDKVPGRRVVQKKGDDIQQEVSDLNGEGLAHERESLNLTIENKEVEPIVQQECDLDWDMSKSGNVGLAETENKRSRLSCDDNIKGVDIEMEMKKKDYSNDKVQIGGRVLHSMSKRADNKISDDGEALHLTNENKEVEPIVQQECDLDWDMSDGRNVELAENGNKKSSLSCDDNIEGVDNEMEVKKKDDSNDKVQIGGRVLCSMSKRAGSKICDDGEALNLTMENKEVEPIIQQEYDFDWEMSKSGNVGLVENGNKRSSLSCDDSIEGVDIEMEVKRKDYSNDKVRIGGRVLRSMSKRANNKISDDSEINGVLVGKNREHERVWFEKNKVKEGKEERGEFVSNVYEKEGNDRRELKRKRGRPPKLKMVEQDQVVGDMQRKRGRPPKMKMKERDQLVGEKLKRKRGRPPKAGENYNILKLAHNGKGKVGFRKGKKVLTMRDGMKMTATDDMCSKSRSSVKELRKKRFLLKTENSEVALPSTSNSVNPPRINKVKQLVRKHIMELLLAAGWTVDYRPRNDKEYSDAVYISPDGKTHWSITLAYKRLKEHSEAGDGEGKVYRPGFKFSPIPNEEFNILTKVMKKKRKSKEKLKQIGGKGEDTVNEVNKKVKKENLGFVAGYSKSRKGKMKRKFSLVEEDNPDVTSYKRFPVLFKDRRRQKTQNKKRSALLVRNAEEEIDSEISGYVPYNGRRTVLSWMIGLGTVLQNGKVRYVNHRRKGAQLEGRITGDGIHCDCCNKIVTISEFEAHAGSRLSDPLKNIYIEGGTSLLQCLLDSWSKLDESERKGFHFIDTMSEDPNDDTCGVCGDGGDLICCDGCPSTFHQSCLNIIKFPSGDWHCIYCCCKFCGLVGGSTYQRDGYDDFTACALLTCRLCEQKYHRSCVEANGVVADDFSVAFYCGNRCQELSERLERLLGVKHEIKDGFSWTFIRRSGVGSDASQIESQMVECNSKLAVALSVMDECFMPYIDHRSGINLIHSVLYNCGSNFNRLNYSGFITAILERGDEVICAASIRIRGNQLAEMPFIGTRYMYRRQGMCRRLLSAIELALSFLNVELLVIPAISELRETWTSVFGFEPLEVTRKQIIKGFNLLVFPHVDMLQKEIAKPKVADENLIPTEVSNPQLQKNQSTHGEATNCDGAGSFASDLIMSAGSGIPASNICQINDKRMSIEAGSPDGLLNSTHDITHETIHHDTNPKDTQCQVVCRAIYDNLTLEDKTTANAQDYVSDAQFQAAEINTCQNAESGCIILAHDEKTVGLDNQLKICCGSGDCQSIEVAPGSCEDIANGVNDRNSDVNDKPWMKQSSELPELDFQVDQTARSNAPSLCSPNTASGVALHCASASGTSCGNTEVIVLSNQAS